MPNMTTVTAEVGDITGLVPATAFIFSAPQLRESEMVENRIVSTYTRVVYPVNGHMSVDLEPGLAQVQYGWEGPYLIDVPASLVPVPLWPLLASAVAVPPQTPAGTLAAAIDAYLSAHPPAAALPPLPGHAGEFLTTDGANPSWDLQRVTITDDDKDDIASDVEDSLEPPVDLTILFANSLV